MHPAKLLAIASAALLASSPGVEAKRKFTIMMARFAEDWCSMDSLMDPDKWHRLHEKSGCYTFDAPFKSFSFVWQHYDQAWESGKDYGHCKIETWEDDNCEGRKVGVGDDINLNIKKGFQKFEKGSIHCESKFRDLECKYGLAKSAKVTCIKHAKDYEYAPICHPDWDKSEEPPKDSWAHRAR